ncbi:hypothetical protein HanRHA438_Chr11g0513421 [Helianthus annuus]|uniref:PHD finger protein ALFIN-LIKE n=1 Tax=Helianthus annuus TaxID=4232 RepID=A0A251TNU2_HELAN|nr:hypothetical protein HanXRQr2_Chr11g0500681 [Helianthus annuus]KAJ0502281.1 hypothetical protein HanHA300_Chr11g0410991 [Helianthus annuus]KAJ0510295.1 hypothetical protein HanIR_Chr11g0539061 [Helianthus annuus]KAJ0518201.1 hypothetical protein HanHA89_Chr11g0434641 [Helianthus annuus]KAJ0686232.1 hypothetical protein HanLR1_Chr11g0412291 [Helianthus annuus]
MYGCVVPDKDNLCLYGYPDGTWEVTLPSHEVPPVIPDPALGINFARNKMSRDEWLYLVAVHSDSWLLNVAFFYAAYLNKNQRFTLFLTFKCMMSTVAVHNDSYSFFVTGRVCLT